ncbi:hypothetical protein TRSC58_07351 [Trypanosoma rangeli SC58]|uniref:Secreted peptide n=1 Tax=Trypanosoma rangeli SC58 TaxID=429131 RepID=A0A061IRN3_TRYRA|nr:hypothetical protein TRSC58_07351 [Trypanosoma rangeli SC58]
MLGLLLFFFFVGIDCQRHRHICYAVLLLLPSFLLPGFFLIITSCCAGCLFTHTHTRFFYLFLVLACLVTVF